MKKDVGWEDQAGMAAPQSLFYSYIQQKGKEGRQMELRIWYPFYSSSLGESRGSYPPLPGSSQKSYTRSADRQQGMPGTSQPMQPPQRDQAG